jgi:gamma-glutamyltranspeptidase/glutathione hydrolase
MCPTIILKNNKPFLVLGSPGGSTIPTVVLQVILNVIDFGMDIQEAIDKPRIHHQWLPDRIEYEKFGLTQNVKNALIKMGQFIGEERILGRVEGIEYDNQNKIFLGASDPRGFGAAIGY